MSTSRTTTTTIGSIPITTNQPPAPTRLMALTTSDKERELELEMERNRERMRVLKEKRKAKEKAKKKAEEEAVKRATEEEERQHQEAIARAAKKRQLNNEGSNHVPMKSGGGNSPVDKEGHCFSSAGDPDDGDDGSDGGDDEDDEDEKAPCKRCRIKKIPCLQQEGKRNTVICKSCHDSKVRCSYSGRSVASKQRERGSGERLAVMESQLAQGLADVRSLREAMTRTNQYLWQILRRQDKVNGRLIAIETRLSMAGSVTLGPSRTVLGKPRVLKRRRVEEETDDDEEEEEEEEKQGGEEGEEESEPAPKKARSEKGKERAE
ncbi:hypothetical protein F5876DRAFT_83837 [Lentinula aff. lateritia]|uniref:Uncharacterized protein n=1 Tax=Lentinula aff. lateritia TaxID=2804960 RepID=A0ACC1THA5_9AGAR|nr:hypothetical protein F5876DRAFT_83837 [Lentinula aff. lateritia]